MRKILYLIGIFIFVSACIQNNKEESSVEILMNTWNHKFNDRNGQDYIKLWVNDTLLFSDTFHIDYVDSIEKTWLDFRMKLATIHKANRDSVKIRIRLISLDSVLFAGRHAVDTTFNYRIENISCLVISRYRKFNNFHLIDPVKNPMAFQID